MESNWTLDELSRRVAVALSVGYEGQKSGRVREVPDARVIRYYGTLGLVDRPVLEGRTALYGPRHLEQIVATKRLQAAGHPLSEVQRRLHGVTDRELARIARLPAEALQPEPWRGWGAGGNAPGNSEVVSAPAPEDSPSASEGGGPGAKPLETMLDAEPAMRGQAFWTERPAEVHRERTPHDGEKKEAKAADVSAPAPHQEKQPVYGTHASDAGPIAVRLAGDVLLVVDAMRPMTEADLEAIRRAAAPLLETMSKRALTGGK